MSNFLRYNFLNLFILLVLSLLLSGFQTTFWFQMFGHFPSPLLWLNLVLYLILYRRSEESIFLIYFIALIIKPFTAMPIGILWLTLLALHTATLFMKKRVFWPSTRYFLFASFGISLGYHITYIFISRWLDHNPTQINFFHRLLEIIFTTLSATPMYYLLTWMDRWTQKETLPESSGGEL